MGGGRVRIVRSGIESGTVADAPGRTFGANDWTCQRLVELTPNARDAR